jgi:hypothetical protein
MYERDPEGKRPLFEQESIWAVDCPVKSCRAKQGQRCREYGKPVHEHRRRVQRMNRKVVKVEIPTWFESNRGRH